MRLYLRNILISLLFAICILTLGFFYPLVYLFIFTFLTPVSLFLINFSKSIEVRKGIFISLTTLFLIDFMFRIYGGGMHDQVGKTICDISLITGVCIILILFIVVEIRIMKKKLNLNTLLKSILFPALCWLILSLSVYLITNNF